MKVHTYEKAFLTVGALLLVGCLGALFYASSARGIHLPGHDAHIDPALVRQTPPFDQPGVHQTGPNSYDAVIIGSAWSFTPTEIRVPVGAEITFVATSTDVLHGLMIPGTRVNVMLIPGQVTRTTYTFREPGEYQMLCHEYCGLGHHIMAGKVIVE
ncbi:MAG TPA: cytochrome c oxidase subunit II [Longimicrobiales bacterium]|nr:cytochrome c oxidase subunit II [Longimicrobiales bacterium]